MYDVIRQMQKDGIFKLSSIPNKLDKELSEISDDKELLPKVKEIQDYVKILVQELRSKNTNVKLVNNVYDFYDKFSLELPLLFNTEKQVLDDKSLFYEKDINFGKAKSGIFGINVNCEKETLFTIEEQKLLKLINHYYISLCSDVNYGDEPFYIPMDSLKLLFVEDVNQNKRKNDIINAYTKLINKKISWDLSDTQYSKKIDEDIIIGNFESLVDLSLICKPRIQKMSIKGIIEQKETFIIMGIVCRPNSFMKMRYSLKQISNFFPITSFSKKDQIFNLTNQIVYHLNLIEANNSRYSRQLNIGKKTKEQKRVIENKIKKYLNRNLSDILNSSFHNFYKEEIEENKKTQEKDKINKIVKLYSFCYFSLVIQDKNQKRKLKEIFLSLLNSIYCMVECHSIKSAEIIVNDNPIPLFYKFTDKLILRDLNDLFNEILLAHFMKNLRLNSMTKNLYNKITELGIPTDDKEADIFRNEIKKKLNRYEYQENKQQQAVNNILNNHQKWVLEIEKIRNEKVKYDLKNIHKRLTILKLIADGEISIKVEF